MGRLLPCLCLLLAACSSGGHDAPDSPAPRIVSMSPALTEMVVELGGGRFIVGRSPFCGAVDAEVPVVGDLLNVHWEHLARVRPTHVLVQTSEPMLDPSLRALASRRGWRLIAHPLVGTDDIRSAMHSLPEQLELPDIDAGVARNRADGFEQMIEQIIDQGPVVDQERILLVSPMDPPLAWGTATYLGQIAEQMGAVNALELEGWSPIGYEDLVRCRTDRILVVSAHEPDPDHTLFTALGRLPSDVDVEVLVHPNLNLPATHLPGIMRSMRAVLNAKVRP
jgi:ABC-type hemin transport system substrate-binding protein